MVSPFILLHININTLMPVLLTKQKQKKNLRFYFEKYLLAPTNKKEPKCYTGDRHMQKTLKYI